MEFEKYHGTGNDFIIFNNLSEEVPQEDMSSLAKKLCDRHFGIGADGLIGIKKVDGKYFMDYWNNDGSFAEMCGNGVRCTAHYIIKNIINQNVTNLIIKTGDGNKELDIFYVDDKLSSVKVNMGTPTFIEDIDVKVDDEIFSGSSVSMGNPHFIIFDKDLSDKNVLVKGKIIENDVNYFANKTNVEFSKIVDKNSIDLRVWERGCGETLACGTGASATVVAGVLQNKLSDRVTVSLPGGKLIIQWDGKGNLFLTGPSEFVFRGNFLV